jgi:WD40 repeat protein
VRMRTVFHAGLIGLAGLLFAPAVAGFAGGDLAYVAAVYSGGPAFVGEQRLTLFPLDTRKARDIALPFPLGYFVFSSDGKALYAETSTQVPGTRPRAGLLRIEFNPTRVSPVLGGSGFRSSFGLAVSAHQDKLLISGPHWNGARIACGVFELLVKDGSVRQILESSDCHVAEAHSYLSLSPNGTQAVAIHNRSLELIDLARGASKSLGEEFYKASWSPDGKWIAALEYSPQQRTILFDASSFTPRRMLGTTDLKWSPDSRYLLGWKWQALCGPAEVYTLEAIEVETGKSSTIASSKCELAGGVAGWLSSEIAPLK